MALGVLSGPARLSGVDFRHWFPHPESPSEIRDDTLPAAAALAVEQRSRGAGRIKLHGVPLDAFVETWTYAGSDDGKVCAPCGRSPFNRRHVFAAALTSLNTMSVAVFADRAPFVRTVRCRTVANTLSIGFDVRR